MDNVKNIEESADGNQIITEGLATISMPRKVFYNPVQEFNRDLSICVLTAFAEVLKNDAKMKNNSETTSPDNKDVEIIINAGNNSSSVGEACVDEDGLTILEALSASGLRSIRYAKEIRGVKQIIANDISQNAVESIRANITSNGVEHIVETSHSDAIMLMYSHRQHLKFDAIDLDPYGCPTTFLDSAVQAVANGGLLLVTATDMAVLAGNGPQTCYYKYGAISLRIKSCHEMALRILLQCIEAQANKYSRYIEPLLSISADFYIRVFVRVFYGPAKCKLTTSKLAMVFSCTGCRTFTLQPLGGVKQTEKNNIKYCLPTGPAINQNCEHCSFRHHMGGPIWAGPLHNKEFVSNVLRVAPQRLGTWKRIQGVLNVILEELDVPLYYTLEQLSCTLHCETPPMLLIRSAILNGGYGVSFTHTNKTSIKTNAPAKFIWDILRTWEKTHPIKRDRLSDSNAALKILNAPITYEINFEMHKNANPESRRKGFVRFQENPTPHWGPGTRATAMVGEKMSKSKNNQGKRKRDKSNESNTNANKKMECDEPIVV